MKKYILKRLLSVLPILFIVSVVVFTLVHLAPGGPAAAMLGSDATMEDIAALEEQMGLNDRFTFNISAGWAACSTATLAPAPPVTR